MTRKMPMPFEQFIIGFIALRAWDHGPHGTAWVSLDTFNLDYEIPAAVKQKLRVHAKTMPGSILEWNKAGTHFRLRRENVNVMRKAAAHLGSVKDCLPPIEAA